MIVNAAKRNHTYGYTVKLVVWECPSCGIVYGVPNDFADQCRANGQRYYCPNGHSLGWTETDADRLKAAEAKQVALADQLHAAEAEAESRRLQILRDRHRFANGVCPCCKRSFENVRRHMESQHPDYDPADLTPPKNKCSCGRSFDTLRGLAIHQGRMRSENWSDPNLSRWSRHTTVVDR